MPISITNFSEIYMKQVSPFPMDTTMGLSPLNLTAGMNGAGKSFINKLIWFSATVINTYVGSLYMGRPMIDDELQGTLQYFLDKSFTTDHMEGEYELCVKDSMELKTTSFKFKLLNGVVTEVELITDADTPTRPPMYMSTSTRTFKAFDQYFQIKKLLGVDLSAPDEAKFDELCKTFPLYDILAMESIMIKLNDPESVANTIKTVNKFDSANITLAGIKYIFVTDDIVYVSGDTFSKKASDMSDGEQAILMITLASS